MEAEVLPAETVFAEQLRKQQSRWAIPPVLEELKRKAQAQGLWNFFLTHSERGPGLTNAEYAPL